MSMAPEVYKGIEFIRISTLAEEQKKLFWQSFDQHKIIKILKHDSLLNDCVLVKDFLEWQSLLPAGKSTALQSQGEAQVPMHAFSEA